MVDTFVDVFDSATVAATETVAARKILVAIRGAGAGTSIAGAGTVVWNHPGNITISDNAGATALLKNSTTQYLRASHFGFDEVIASGAVITGIQVGVEKNAGAGNAVVDHSVRLVDGDAAIVGDDKASAATWPTSDAAVGYGGHADRWSSMIDADDVRDSDFGVVLSATNPTLSSYTANVDHVAIAVYHYYPPTPVVIQDFAGISAVESVAVLVLAAATDNATVEATESVAVVELKDVADAATVSAPEAVDVAAFVTVADTATVSATELAGQFVPVEESDSAEVLATEAVAVAELKEVSDSATVEATESISTVEADYVTVTDSATISATEEVEGTRSSNPGRRQVRSPHPEPFAGRARRQLPPWPIGVLPRGNRLRRPVDPPPFPGRVRRRLTGAAFSQENPAPRRRARSHEPEPFAGGVSRRALAGWPDQPTVHPRRHSGPPRQPPPESGRVARRPVLSREDESVRPPARECRPPVEAEPFAGRVTRARVPTSATAPAPPAARRVSRTHELEPFAGRVAHRPVPGSGLGAAELVLSRRVSRQPLFPESLLAGRAGRFGPHATGASGVIVPGPYYVEQGDLFTAGADAGQVVFDEDDDS